MIPFSKYFKSVLIEIKDFNFFVAGGSVSALHYNLRVEQDLDIFFRTEKDFLKLKSYFDEHYFLANESVHACSYYDNKKFGEAQDKIIIQLVKTQFGTPEKVISNFDINKSMIALDIKNKDLIYDPRFWEPLHACNYNHDTLKRLAKYSDRVKETPDWYMLISKFLEDFEVNNYYTDDKHKSKLILESFLKNYLVTSYSNDVTLEISKALQKFIINTEWVKFLECVFIPYDTSTDIYIIQVLYYKYFTSITSDNMFKNNEINKRLQMYGAQIKKKNPEYLFF